MGIYFAWYRVSSRVLALAGKGDPRLHAHDGGSRLCFRGQGKQIGLRH